VILQFCRPETPLKQDCLEISPCTTCLKHWRCYSLVRRGIQANIRSHLYGTYPTNTECLERWKGSRWSLYCVGIATLGMFWEALKAEGVSMRKERMSKDSRGPQLHQESPKSVHSSALWEAGRPQMCRTIRLCADWCKAVQNMCRTLLHIHAPG
jgi:hypothetical protein